MPPFRILILEDEYPAAERLQRLLAQAAPTAQVLAVRDTVAGALAWLDQHPAPDLILSDIQLADGLSLDVFAQTLVRSPIIFTTAYDQYALQAFRANGIDYLLKPLKLPELQRALARLHFFNEELFSANSSFLIPHSSFPIQHRAPARRAAPPAAALQNALLGAPGRKLPAPARRRRGLVSEPPRHDHARHPRRPPLRGRLYPGAARKPARPDPLLPAQPPGAGPAAGRAPAGAPLRRQAAGRA